MKLISKEVKTDPNTFAPILQVTVEIPIEPVQDGGAIKDVDEVKKILGSKFYDILASN